MLLHILGVLAIVISAVYYFIRRPFSQWTKRDIVGPKPNWFYGNFPNIVWQDKHVSCDYWDLYNEYRGKERFIGVYFARTPQIIIVDNELVKSAAITYFRNFHDNEFVDWFNLDPIWRRNPAFMKGEAWKTKRAEVLPAVTKTKLNSMYPIMQITGGKLSKYIEKVKSEEDIKGGVNAKEIMFRFLIENMTDCLYGVEAGAFTDSCPIRTQITLFVGNLFKMINFHFITRLFPLAAKFITAPLTPKSVETFFVGLTKQVVERRRSSQTPRFDLLNFFMDSKDKKPRSHIDLVGLAMIFVLDGIETTSVVLSSVMLFLAREQDVQIKLREELLDAVNEKGELSFETIGELQYLDNVIHETLRMMPPASFLIKFCTESCEFEDSRGKKVPIYKGDSIVFPVLGIHYDERFYKDPFKFDPDRFNPEHGGVKKYREIGAYLAFGIGPRMCLGMRLALLQMKVAIAEVIRNWEVCPNPRMQEKVDFEPSLVFLMQRGGVWLDFKRIHSH